MVTLYGLKSCDTVRRARRWLDAAGVAHVFHDWRAQGVEPGLIAGWADRLGWERLLNRSGTTFRGLPEADRTGLDRDRAVALMLAHPAAIRRPVAVAGDVLLVGFDPDAYVALG